MAHKINANKFKKFVGIQQMKGFDTLIRISLLRIIEICSISATIIDCYSKWRLKSTFAIFICLENDNEFQHKFLILKRYHTV